MARRVLPMASVISRWGRNPVARFGKFDSTAPAPQPITGWYDDKLIAYSDPPPIEQRFPVTDEQWNARIGAEWHVNGGILQPVPPPSPAKPQRIPSTAFLNRFPAGVLTALAASPATLVLLITCAAAGDIDLADPTVQAGINSLVPALLTAPQAAAILDH